MGRKVPGPGAYGFVKALKHPVGWVTKALLDGEITGQENIPGQGPYIVTANHLSLTDPVFVMLGVRELVRFLALDELFGQSKALDKTMYYFGSIPISRVRPPLGALHLALEVLEAGEILGVFPEGGRAAYWKERSIKRGAAWLSMATGAPIIPCAITGTESTLSLVEPGIHLPSVRLSYHPPLYPGSYIDHEDPLGSMMDDWVAVLDDQLAHWTRESET